MVKQTIGEWIDQPRPPQGACIQSRDTGVKNRAAAVSRHWAHRRAITAIEHEVETRLDRRSAGVRPMNNVSCTASNDASYID
jgi:hypothetical protein